jgi:hypothetical protein
MNHEGQQPMTAPPAVMAHGDGPYQVRLDARAILDERYARGDTDRLGVPAAP